MRFANCRSVLYLPDRKRILLDEALPNRLLRGSGWRPLGQAELALTDDNGERHRFYFETFFNQYDALTLGRYLRPELRVMAVSG